MFSPAKLVVFFTAALSVAAMPSHMARSPHNHREVAARVAQPEPIAEIEARDMAVPAKRVTRRRRASTGRCKPKDNSVVPSSTGKEDPKPSSESAPPKTPEVKEVKPTSTPPKEDPKPTPTPTKEPDTPASPTPTPDSGSGGGQVYNGQGT